MSPLDTDRWEFVESSNLSALGTKGDWLIAQFKGGEIYRYRGLAHLFEDLLSAPSIGKLFHTEVRLTSKGERLRMEDWPEDEDEDAEE